MSGLIYLGRHMQDRHGRRFMLADGPMPGGDERACGAYPGKLGGATRTLPHNMRKAQSGAPARSTTPGMIQIHEAGDRPRVAMSRHSLAVVLTAWDWLTCPIVAAVALRICG